MLKLFEKEVNPIGEWCHSSDLIIQIFRRKFVLIYEWKLFRKNREGEFTKKISEYKRTWKRGNESKKPCKSDGIPSIQHVISHWLLIPRYHLLKHSSTCQENMILLQSYFQLLSDCFLHKQTFIIGKWSTNAYHFHNSISGHYKETFATDF